MVTAAVIIGILFTILVFIAFMMSDKKGEDFNLGASMAFIIMFLAIIEVGIIADIIKIPQPTAMDVYQGKTTLEYNIRDNVKIDSIVVFKDNIYGKEN
jgi:hypothetical protein